MRKTLSVAIAAVLVAMSASMASAGSDRALEYRTADNLAQAWFGDGLASASVRIEEAIRPDPAFSHLWVRASMANYGEPFVFCNGVTDATGVHAYAFRNTGAHFDATIPFFCSDGSGPFDVRVTATWETEGSAVVDSTTTAGVDDMGFRFVRTVRYSTPQVASASMGADFEPFPIPAFSHGELSMRTLHTVYPQPGGLLP